MSKWEIRKEKWSQLKVKFDEYYAVIQQDFHKSKDRYFQLGLKYDALGDEKEQWVVTHNGYVNSFECVGSSPDEAIESTMIKLDALIEKEKDFQSK